jgi:hypothetical protein
MDGKAWGLMMMSGCIPDSVNGMSVDGHFWDKIPFCPCRDENLSPILGLRGIRYLIVNICMLFSLDSFAILS